MRYLLILSMVLFAGVAQPRAGEPGDSIRAVIEAQLDAFAADDLPAAFAFASPGIQAKFGTPRNFGRMVETGYPMIWRPVSHQMLGLEKSARGTVQKVLFQDSQGRLFEASYDMRRIDGAWRIAGVYLHRVEGVTS